MDPVPGIPICEPNQPGPSITFMLRKKTINAAKITVKILIPSNYKYVYIPPIRKKETTRSVKFIFAKLNHLITVVLNERD